MLVTYQFQDCLIHLQWPATITLIQSLEENSTLLMATQLIDSNTCILLLLLLSIVKLQQSSNVNGSMWQCQLVLCFFKCSKFPPSQQIILYFGGGIYPPFQISSGSKKKQIGKCAHGSCSFVKIKFKNFSKTFKNHTKDL